MPVLSPYRAVLRTPYAGSAFAASLVGRLCYGTVSLSLILTLTAGGRGYAVAGLVMALFGVSIVLASPVRAKLVDRYGPRRALPPMAAGFPAVLVVVAFIPVHAGVNDAAIAVLVVAAGVFAPPLGVVMRALWGRLVEDCGVLHTAYSLDGVAEELLYVGGPVIVGVITVVAAPSVGLLVSAGLAVGGTALFLRSSALRHAAGPAGRGDGGTAPPAPGSGRAILALALATGALGLCLGGLGLVIVAFSQSRHDPAAVAWIEAVQSAGSALAASATAPSPGGCLPSVGSPCWSRAWPLS